MYRDLCYASHFAACQYDWHVKVQTKGIGSSSQCRLGLIIHTRVEIQDAASIPAALNDARQFTRPVGEGYIVIAPKNQATLGRLKYRVTQVELIFVHYRQANMNPRHTQECV